MLYIGVAVNIFLFLAIFIFPDYKDISRYKKYYKVPTRSIFLSELLNKSKASGTVQLYIKYRVGHYYG